MVLYHIWPMQSVKLQSSYLHNFVLKYQVIYIITMTKLLIGIRSFVTLMSGELHVPSSRCRLPSGRLSCQGTGWSHSLNWTMNVQQGLIYVLSLNKNIKALFFPISSKYTYYTLNKYTRYFKKNIFDIFFLYINMCITSLQW